MENYFLLLDKPEDKWLNEWFTKFVQSKIEIIPISHYIRPYDPDSGRGAIITKTCYYLTYSF